MIDTDKYEGHTPGPWDYEYGPTVSEHIDDADILTIKTEATFDEDKAWANQRLAADAPLLLQEVKRLREKIWIFTDEHHAEHEFSDPYEMMKYMWHHYIEDDVKIGWKVKKNEC